MLRFPLNISCKFCSPIALARASRMAGTGRKVLYFTPEDVVFDWRKVLKGTEKAYGMWPEERPGRGSLTAPVNLMMCS